MSLVLLYCCMIFRFIEKPRMFMNLCIGTYFLSQTHTTGSKHDSISPRYNKGVLTGLLTQLPFSYPIL